MKIIPDDKTEMQEIQTQESRYQRYSRRALKNMHEFAEWRVMQLEHHNGVLHFLGSFGGELEDLFAIAERIERVEKNHKNFEKLEKELLYELVKRDVREDDDINSNNGEDNK